MKKLLLFIALALVMQSCVVLIDKSPYGESNFMTALSSEQKNMVYWTSDSTSLEGLVNDGRIYAINPNQLKELLKSKEIAIVYKWLPTCTSENCTSLGLTQSYCDEKGVELYVVADNYNDAFSQIEDIKNPMFSINSGYYVKTNYLLNKLQEQFYKELLGEKYDKKNYHRFYYFENGEFVRMYDSVVNL